jgi:hypothetical protein
VLRAGEPIRHADARRLRLFDLDIFFLGTAMGLPRRMLLTARVRAGKG